jgi:hypothetical protein
MDKTYVYSLIIYLCGVVSGIGFGIALGLLM